MEMTALPAARTRIALCIGGGAVVALLLAWASVAVNLERACAVADTPYLLLCGDGASGTQHVERLRARIAANPGDTAAYVQLALAEPGSAQGAARLTAAARLAPADPNVQLLKAARAAQGEDWAAAVEPLVQLVEFRASEQAAQVLARLIAGNQGHLMVPHLTPGSRWFTQVLTAVSQGDANFSAALPLVTRALEAEALDPGVVRAYMGRLKATRNWADAYSLWLVLQGPQLPALYNAGFDQYFDTEGFDWEVASQSPVSRAGAVMGRPVVDKRGAVLDIRFTQRPIPVPLVRQHLFLGEGRYRLRGEFKGSQFRLEQGLAWTVRCGANAAAVGKSEPLGDTNGDWSAFQFDFTLPRDCGLVASLQLETYAPYAAGLGARGRIAFDAFSLEKVAP